MSPDSFNSFRFSARCLAANSLGVPLQHIDPLGCSRSSGDVAGIKAAVSPGFAGRTCQFTHVFAAADSFQPTSGVFQVFARWACRLLARGPKLLPSKVAA